MDEQARLLRRAQARRRVRRQRLLALGGVGMLIPLGLLTMLGTDGSGRRQRSDHRTVSPARPAELPGGGRQILPTHRVVAYYGAPGDPRLGILGAGPPDQVARQLERQAARYRFAGRPVLPAMELIATVATSSPGADGLYRARQPAAVVRSYLRAARRAGALLILDLQPGRSDFMTEARVYEPFLREPDVSLALDPEWHLAPGQVPGQQIGSTDAGAINEVSAYLARIVAAERLPQKLLIVHRFTSDMIQQPNRIVLRSGLAITINIDGFGDQANKIAKYRVLSKSAPSTYYGFKLFYQQDLQLMTPKQVMKLRPSPALIVYQ